MPFTDFVVWLDMYKFSSIDVFLQALQSRAGQLSPMQWSDKPNAGFTSGKPWIPVAGDYPMTNVEVRSKFELKCESYCQQNVDYAFVANFGLMRVFAYDEVVR